MGGGGKKSSTYYCGLKKTIACATTVAALASSASASKARRDVDGAAFLETFDDGLDGWVKSEVEQYTGASSLFLFFFVFFFFFSVCVFFACFLARASRVCLAFSSPRARFESIEEQRERLRCIVHQKKIRSEKKRSRCRSLSYHRSNETTASPPKSDDGPPGEIDRSTRADDTKQQ